MSVLLRGLAGSSSLYGMYRSLCGIGSDSMRWPAMALALSRDSAMSSESLGMTNLTIRGANTLCIASKFCFMLALRTSCLERSS